MRLRKFIATAVLTLLVLSIVGGGGHLYFEHTGAKELLSYRPEVQRLSSEFAARGFRSGNVHASTTDGNGAHYYRMALEQVDKILGDERWVGMEKALEVYEGGSVNPEELDLELTKFSSILGLLSQATRHSECSWSPAIYTHQTCSLNGATIPRIRVRLAPNNLPNFDLVSLLLAQAFHERQAGNDAGALRLTLEALQTALDLGRGLDSLHDLFASTKLQTLSGHIVRNMDGVSPSHPGWHQLMSGAQRAWGEKADVPAVHKEVLARALYIELNMPTVPRILLLDTGESNAAANWTYFLDSAPLFFSEQAAASAHAQLIVRIDKELDGEQLSYDPAGIKAIKGVLDRFRNERILFREVPDAVLDAYVNSFRLEASLRLLQVVIHLARYRAREGQWPDSLEAVSIPSGLENPFTGRPFRYMTEGRPRLLMDGIDEYSHGHIPEWELPE